MIWTIFKLINSFAVTPLNTFDATQTGKVWYTYHTSIKIRIQGLYIKQAPVTQQGGHSMQTFSAERFNRQANTHDTRTGIPEHQCIEIARAVRALTESSKNELLLDLGAGTGLPGAWFTDEGFRYIGLDASESMLKLFAQRRTSFPDTVELVLANVNERWPVTDATVGVVFSSRAAHMFDREHLADETERVGRPGVLFILGRVQRENNSMRKRLRDAMRTCLIERGFQPAAAGREHARILEEFCKRGATLLPTVVAAKWNAGHSAEKVLNSWTSTPGLGGCELAPMVKQEVMMELWSWAEKYFDSIETVYSSEERFTLEAVRL